MMNRLDAADSALLYRELQAIEAKVLEQPFPEFLSPKLIPYDTQSVPRGALEWGFYRLTPAGMARWIASNVNDLPRVSLAKVRVTFPIREMAIAAAYTWAEIEAARTSGFALEAAQVAAARRGINAFTDKVLIEGDASVGLTGFANDPLIPITTVAAVWSAATADAIIADMNTGGFAIWNTSKHLYQADTLALPPTQFAKITTTPRSASSDSTIWNFFLNNSPFIRNIIVVPQLATAGVGGGPRAVIYKRDPEVVEAKIAIPFEQADIPQHQGTEIQIPYWSRIGGTTWKVPMAALYLDGI